MNNDSFKKAENEIQPSINKQGPMALTSNVIEQTRNKRFK